MLLRNALCRSLAILASVAVALVSAPLLVRQLGPAGYGLWVLVVSVGSFLAVLDLGLASALNRFLAADLAAGREPSLRETIAVALFLYLAVAAVTILAHLGLALAGLGLFAIPDGERGSFRLALALAGPGVALGFPARIYESILLARERHHLVALVEGASHLARLLVVLLVVLLDGGLVLLSLATSLLLAATHLAMWRVGRAGLPAAAGTGPRLFRRRAGELLAYGRDTWLGLWAAALRDQGPAFLLAAFSPAAVAHYGLGSRLLSYPLLGMGAAVSVINPRLVNRAVTGQEAGLRETFLRGLQNAGLAAAGLALGLWLLGPWFIRLWVGEEFAPAGRLVEILAPAAFLAMALLPCEELLLALSRQRLTAWLRLGEAGLALAVVALGGAGQGVLAAGMGLLAGALLLRPWLLVAAGRELGLAPGELWRGAGRGTLRTLAATGLVGFAGLGLWPYAGWPGLLGAGAGLGLVHLAAAWWLGLDAEGRRAWRAGWRGLGSPNR